MKRLRVAVLMGGLTVILMVILKLWKLNQPIPFALFLASGAVVTLLWGREISNLISLLVT